MQAHKKGPGIPNYVGKWCCYHDKWKECEEKLLAQYGFNCVNYQVKTHKIAIL